MLRVDKLPYLKIYKQKALLPIDPKRSTMYGLIFLNSPNIEASINMMDIPLLTTNSKYLNYYIERMYKEKIVSKNVNINYRKDTEAIHDKVKEHDKMMKTHLLYNNIKGKNLYYDLFMYNNIFFNNIKVSAMKKKASLYINYLSKIINNGKFSIYKNRTMLIKVEDWAKDDNPITFFMLAYRFDFETLKALGNTDIILYTDKAFLKFNPSLLDPTEYSGYKREINKLLKTSSKSTNIEEIINNEEKVSDDKSPEVEVKKSPRKVVDDLKDEDGTTAKVIIDTLPDEEKEDVLNNADTELVKKLYDETLQELAPKSKASSARDKLLREKQKELTLDGITLEDYKELEKIDEEIEKIDIEKSVSTINKNATEVKFTNFEKAYNDKLMRKDTVNIITGLNDKSIPMYIRKISVEDTSDKLNYKETYTINLEDENRVRHTIKVDMPKFLDDKFLYLGGNKKVIIKQLFPAPVIKTSPDEVQICTNYNKSFITRYGTKVSSKVERLKKALADNIKGVRVTHGDCSKANDGFITNIEYDELAKNMFNIRTKDMEIIFDQNEVAKKLEEYNVDISKTNSFCIGFYKDRTPILCDKDTEKIPMGDNKVDIVNFIVSNSPKELQEIYSVMTPGGKRFIYSRAKIMTKNIHMIILLSYWEGLTKVLHKADIKHRFTDKRPSITENESYVQFEDGYLIYDKYPFENSLLMNALQSIPTKAFKYEEMDTKEPYLELFESLYNSRYIAGPLDTFYEFMIDPITLEILKRMNYPTDIVSLFLYANKLLADNSYTNDTDMGLFRLRSNEIANAILYKKIADAYGAYKRSSGNNNPTKLSIPQDAVIKEIVTTKTVEEMATINPIYELDKTRSVTRKGVNGMNLDDAYTEDKRTYDKSMMGIMGVSTSPDYNVGVVRKLSMEPNIKNARGFIDTTDNIDELTDVNMFSPAELLTPGAVVHDDSTRTAMATKQSNHIIPVKKADPVLVSNGYEQTIQHSLSKDFVVVAEDDGVVSEVDESTGLIVVTYKNGKSQAIDTKPKVVKNSSSGFYISNQMDCNLKKGQKVKKDDILAYEDKFFTDDKINGNRFNIGSLQKVAFTSAYNTFEDSTVITNKMANEMSTDIVMMKDVIIGKNANISNMVKVGDKIKVGDTLVNFEASYKDDSINKFLDKIGDELQEEISSLTRTPIKSKYSGVIEDIKIYCSVDLDDLSPSLRKVVSEYYAMNKKKKKILDKYDDSPGVIKAGILFNEPTGKTELDKNGKIKGKDAFDSVLIEFYIKYNDIMGVGDKITRIW